MNLKAGVFGQSRSGSITAPFVHGGAMNNEIFKAYMEHVLVPTLSPDNIVVLDNLPAHKAPRARKAIEQVGAQMIFLLPIVSISTRSK
ncbi:hypothetical protein A0U89_12215 [Kozakia baliensis]|uniref:Tc1-like transposase DDE domain-containing protein n=2 Tax=Kozakia baliensis TaxID=153496 RepID=A0A1D8UVU5_9PROT|nr:hypothetical protein A0U89_12215 [Kozakia baliensis]